MGNTHSSLSHLFRAGALSLLLGASSTIPVWGNNFLQDVKLSVHQKNVSISKVLDDIEQQTGYSILVRNSDIDTSKKVSVNMNDTSLDDILEKIFAGMNVKCEVSDKTISIYRPTEVAQNRSNGEKHHVTGIVLDANGEPVIGANILEKGSGTNGTITDVEGRFSLDVASDATLVISYIGYDTQEIPVKGQTTLKVVLREDSELLDEVVVIGYGTANRQAITGAIAKADIETYREVPTNNIMETVKGTIPGLNVGGTNTAGAVASFSIRGQNSTSGNSPLIVVDGAIYNGSLADIPSEDIENFTVLKDASAAAVYGSRSANGVILISTKRGRSSSGKPEFNVNLTYGISNELERKDVYDAPGYLQRILDIREANGQDADPNNIGMYLQAEELKNYNATPDHRPTFSDPYDLFRQNAYNLKANLSISNSSDFATYYISASLTDQKGVVMNDRYKNFSGRVNIDSNLTDWLKVGVKANYSIRDYSGSTPSMNKAAQFSPYASLYDEEGHYLQFPQTTTSFQSPFWSMETDDTEKYNNLGAILTADIKVPWVKGLKVEGSFNYDINNQFEKLWELPYYYYDYNTSTQEYERKQGTGMASAALTDTYSRWTTMLYNYRISYDNQFGKHHVAAMLGQEQQINTYSYAMAYRKNFLSSSIDQINVGSSSAEDKNNGGSETRTARNNFFGRFNYDYAGKYLVELLFRYDGSQNFPVGKRYGFFPAGSVGWRMSEESFIKDNVDFIDQLKLRLSVGQIGNDKVDAYQYLQSYSFGGNYVFGTSDAAGIYANIMPNPNITWEKSTKFDVGFDATLWNGLLGAEFTYFRERRTDLLTARNLSVPNTLGFSGLPDENIGEVKNHGVELRLTHRRNMEEFSYSLEYNMSYAKNEIVFMDETPNAEEYQNQTGHPVGAGLYYKSDGIFNTEEELNSYPHASGTQVGDIKIVDLNNDGVIDSDDQYRFDYSSTPRFVSDPAGSGTSISTRSSIIWERSLSPEKITTRRAGKADAIEPIRSSASYPSCSTMTHPKSRISSRITGS